MFTKIDKLSRIAAENNIAAYKRQLLERWEELPPVFVTSSEKGVGREELRQSAAVCLASQSISVSRQIDYIPAVVYQKMVDQYGFSRRGRRHGQLTVAG